MKWSLAFEKEMEELRVKREGKDQTIGKLSGKQLFQVDSKLIDSDLSFLEGRISFFPALVTFIDFGYDFY